MDSYINVTNESVEKEQKMRTENHYRVRLVEITAENLGDVCQLSNTLSDSQKNCVASNAYSIAQAHYYPEKAWFRGIYLNDQETPIGFIMLDTVADDVPGETEPCLFLWRFMIRKDFQNKGYGKEALDIVAEKFKAEGKKVFYTSCVVDEAEGPYPFYLRYGFIDTGMQEDGEQILKMMLK